LLLAPFSSRSRRIQQNYVHKAMALESDLNDVSDQDYASDRKKKEYGAVNWGEMTKFPKIEHYVRSQNVVVILPLLFAAAFLVALLALLVMKTK